MSQLTRLAIIVCSAGMLISAAKASADDRFFQERWHRWQQQSVRTVAVPTTTAQMALVAPAAKVLVPAFSDAKVNDDGSVATFAQQAADIVYFPDGNGVAVWEDDRNGEWDIYAQLLSSEGAPAGSNIRLIYDDGFASQRQPSLAVNSTGKMMMVWVEEETASLQAMLYNSSLIPQSGMIQVSDATGNNLINHPAISALPSGGFVVVWEDSRDGANIHCQLLDGSGSRLGSNFRANTNVTSPYRIAPAVGASDTSGFAVAWEDARDHAPHIYFRTFTALGAPRSAELKLEQNFPLATQCYPQVGFLKGKAYLVAWISDRYQGQSIYGQLISISSALIDTSFRINSLDSDVCWELRMESTPDSGLGCAWRNTSSVAAIEFRKINKLGVVVGDSKTLQDESTLLERGAPSLALRASGATIIWMDQRNINSDIYQQRLDAALNKVGGNIKLNDDQAGSQQSTPDICGLPQGSVGVVWRDQKVDPGDIMLQRSSFTGTLIGAPVRVNDDPGASLQQHPQIGSSQSGEMVIVWEDSRSLPGFASQNIIAQRLSVAGVRVGSNFIVNAAGSASAKSEPDIAVSSSGSFAIVWVDQRFVKRQVYLQRYNSSGVAVGANQLVADISSATDSYEPHLGIRGDGSLVVSFISIIGARQVLHFQRFDGAGAAIGALQLLAVDTTQVQILDADIFVHDYKGSFFISVIASSATGSSIRMFRYNSDGTLHTGNSSVSDVIDAGFDDLRISGDIDDAMIVTWSDSRSVEQRNWFQLVRDDGFNIGSNSTMHSGTALGLEKEPAAALNNGDYFCVWIDNRHPGKGFDVFLNSGNYTSTDVNEPDVTLPSQYQLEQNYPNPFNPETVISYALAKPEAVKLVVYNVLGEQVKVLVDSYQAAGHYNVTWDGTSSSGGQAASGIYLYRLSAWDFGTTRKMTLLK